jgi:hypothetical protein
MEAAAEGDGGGTVVARLFVGGLAEGVSAADLEGVLGSIGRVAGVEFVRTSGRCFAYVDFECPSNKALTKLFSTVSSRNPIQSSVCLSTSVAISRSRLGGLLVLSVLSN